MILGGLYALVCWTVLLPVIYLLGTCLGSLIKEEDALLKGILTVALGMGVLCTLIMILGTIGRLTMPMLLGFAGILALIRLRKLPEFMEWLRFLLRYCATFDKRLVGTVAQAVFLITAGATLIFCFLPEIAHDSLCYHLNLSKIFVRQASIAPMKFDLKSYQSQFMECLYVVGIMLRSAPVAKMFHWLTGFLLVLSVIRVVEKRAQDRTLALVLGILLWLTPTFLKQVAITYNDVATAFFVWLAFDSFSKAFFGGAGAGHSLRAFFLSGLLMGFGASCKYLALTVALPLGIFAFFYFLFAGRDARRRVFLGLVLFCVGVSMTGSFWFIRSYVLEGNALYPIFTGAQDSRGIFADAYSGCGLPRSFFSFFAIPFLLVFDPAPFEWHSWMGPFYLFTSPFVFLSLRRPALRDSYFAVFTIGTSYVCWFFLAQNVRFLLPLFPLWMISVTDGVQVARIESRPRIGKLLGWSAILLILGLAGLGFYQFRFHAKALAFGWSEEKFLENLERSYPAAQWVNQNLPKDAVLFGDVERRHYYFDRPMIDSDTYYRVERYPDNVTLPEFASGLRRIGMTHVLQVLPANEESQEPRPSQHAIIDALLRDPSKAVKVGEVVSTNIRESRYRYLIYKLL